MGIRFACHHCSHAVHVKDFLAGKRGKCPQCKQSFRIPLSDATYSWAVDDSSMEHVPEKAVLVGGAAPKGATATTFADRPNEKVPSPTVPAQVAIPSSARFTPFSKPHAFQEAPGAAWFVRPPSGGQYGPANEELLAEWIRENRVTQDSLLWREGQPQWRSAIELLPELYAVAAPVASAVPPRAPSPVGTPTLSDLSVSNDKSKAAVLASQRKEKKRKQQWMIIILLLFVSLLLLGGLIAVLFLNRTAAT